MIDIYKTLTETPRNKKEDPSSPTGWSRRVPPTVRGEAHTTEPCDPPRTVRYGSQEHRDSGITGGTIHTHVEGVEPGTYDLTAGEVEFLVRHYLRMYEDGCFLADGNQIVDGQDRTPKDGVLLMQEGIKQLARFGVDATTLDLGRRV